MDLKFSEVLELGGELAVTPDGEQILRNFLRLR